MSEYEHTQHGKLHHIYWGFTAAALVAFWFARGFPDIAVWCLILAATGMLISFVFSNLTVRDGGDRLLLRFGPLPLLRKGIRYADITGVERGRTNWADGWGIHYVPRRGWTFNIWGYDCVKLTLGCKVIRVGSDDVDRLVEFLSKKSAAATPPA